MALVVGREAGQAIILENNQDGTKVRIEVVQTDGMLRLKIEAPKKIDIYREEIYEEQRKNRL